MKLTVEFSFDDFFIKNDVHVPFTKENRLKIFTATMNECFHDDQWRIIDQAEGKDNQYKQACATLMLAAGFPFDDKLRNLAEVENKISALRVKIADSNYWVQHATNLIKECSAYKECIAELEAGSGEVVA